MKAQFVIIAALTTVIAGCASNEAIVTRMAVRDTGCEAAAIEVTEIDHDHYAGMSRYQTAGCGTTHNYRCEKWNNIVMASVGIINLDPRPCEREKR